MLERRKAGFPNTAIRHSKQPSVAKKKKRPAKETIFCYIAIEGWCDQVNVADSHALTAVLLVSLQWPLRGEEKISYLLPPARRRWSLCSPMLFFLLASKVYYDVGDIDNDWVWDLEITVEVVRKGADVCTTEREAVSSLCWAPIFFSI